MVASQPHRPFTSLVNSSGFPQGPQHVPDERGTSAQGRGRVPWPLAHREPLRLNLVDPCPGDGRLGGVWWPQSRDLDVELADLVENFAAAGLVTRVLFSRPDWATSPRWIPAKGGRLRVDSFPEHDTHVVMLSMSDHTTKTLLVIPPGHLKGEHLLKLDVRGQSSAAATELLDQVS